MTDDARARPQLELWFNRLPFGYLIVVVVIVSIVATVVTAVAYSGSATWTSLVTNFSATSLAFLIALAWDRRERELAEVQEAEAEQRRDQAARVIDQDRRESEARRRFAAIALELERLERSLQRTVAEQHRYRYFFPDLPAGSWRASGGALGMIIENYSLMADLSTFYGHVEELQWRLRFRAGPDVDQNAVNPIIAALASQMLKDAAGLLAQVRKQAASPDVLPIDALDARTVVVARRQATAAIRSVDFSDDTP